MIDFRGESDSEDVDLEGGMELPLAPSTRGNKYQSNDIVTAAERNLIVLSVILNLYQNLPPSIHEIPASAGMTVNREIVGTSLKLYSVLFPLIEGKVH
ncbi:hypothetical protein KC711_07400 [Candidatus Peregrinibacteria bacterium]|nr:hypothetical protein [Candidatus Peregrinibacteria bacterium]MCB9804824.1 hypothetical protein [Candidatus Peribacteria bacterium]